MIQRMQSIWLLLATLTLICLFFLPLLTKTIAETESSVYTTGLHKKIDATTGSMDVLEFNFASLALNISAALFSLTAIFLFKNRSLQKRIIFLSILIIIALTVLCGIQAPQLLGGFEGSLIAVGSFLPPLAIISCLLAIRGIRKDEQLLRSADRLR